MRTGLAILLTLLALQQQPPAPILQPDWRLPLQGAVALSPSGRCAAVAAQDELVILDSTGTEVWRWNFRAGNRFTTVTRVAIAPGCDWAALAGDSGYRYVWIVHRSGRRLPLQFRATPLSVAISHSGDRLAVGTGGGELFLYAVTGHLEWRRELEAIAVVDAVAFADSDQAVLVQAWGAAVVSPDGALRWSRGLMFGGMRSSTDLQTTITWAQFSHGPNLPTVSLLDAKGDLVWSLIADYQPSAAISASGGMVAVRLVHDQSIDPQSFFIDTPPANSFTLVSRAGKMVRRLSDPGYPLSFDPDGKRLLVQTAEDIHAIDLEGRLLWRVPAKERYSPPRAHFTADFSALLVEQSEEIEWYTPR